MKQKIIIAVCLLFTAIANAQLNTNLITSPRLPANLAEWSLNPQTVTLIVTNLGQFSKPIKVRTTLKTADGTEVSTTDMSQAKIYVFRDGNTILNSAEVFPYELQRFTAKYQTSLNKTGKLPSDGYQLCVELVLAATLELQAPIKCKTFFVAGSQLPICMMPADKQVLDYAKASTAIIFRWTPIVPKPSTPVSYRLQVFEVLDNQQPMQALRSNQPILDNEIVGQTQFIWQPQGILGLAKEETETVDSVAQKKGWDGTIKGGKQFVWSIQTLDAQGKPIGVDGNYEGRSEPIVFTILNAKGVSNVLKTKHDTIKNTISNVR
jgi:hypothetical protein